MSATSRETTCLATKEVDLDDTQKHRRERKMESFKGNGAECMVQFIKDGCKGAIYRDVTFDQFPVINRAVFDEDADNCKWALGWLTLPCAYYPPEPVYRNATPGEALDAWLNGKEVQRNAATLDKAIANGEWETLIPDGQRGRPYLWQAHHNYRIKED